MVTPILSWLMCAYVGAMSVCTVLEMDHCFPFWFGGGCPEGLYRQVGNN